MDKVVHFEVPCDDLERARKFYQTVFSWKITSIPEMNYTLVTTVETDDRGMPKSPGAINGGFFKREENETPVIVIKVNSLEDSLKKAAAHGAKVVMPKVQVGDMGVYAKIVDTEKNVIGVWQDLKK